MLLIVFVVAVSSYFYFARGRDLNSNPAETPPAKVVPFRHPLTGAPQEQASHFFTVAVMYDNFFSVKAHPGLDGASVVYESLAEGDVTRLMAIFDSSLEVENIGPVRSVRPYFIDWAEEYGGALVHVGGSPQALRQLKSSKLFDINQIGSQEIYFRRDAKLEAPHNVFTSFTDWRKFGERLEIPEASFSPWRFEEPTLGDDRLAEQQVEINFAPDNQIGWVYNKEKNNYLRFFNGERQLFVSGVQVSAANIIIMETKARVIDNLGRMDVTTSGQGRAKIYHNGREIDGWWYKADPEARLMFYADNDEVVLTPGVSWVEVVFDLNRVKYQAQASGQ